MYLLLALTGLGAGAVYAGIAIGIVTTYKGTGIINFAAGAMGMWSAYVFDELVRNGNLVLPLVIVPSKLHIGQPQFLVALLLALAEAVIIGIAAHFLIFRPLRRSPALAKVVASVGLMLTLQALVIIRFGTTQRAPRPILPNGNVHIFGQTLPAQYLWIAVVVIAVAVLLWAYFRFTRLGIATRGASENEPFIVLAGISPDFLAALTWIAASFAVGLVLTLGSPIVQLNPGLFVMATVPSLAAALIARFTSIGWAAGAGLGLGSVTSVFGYLAVQSWWPSWARSGLTSVLPFLVIVVVLFALGRSIPSRGTGASDPLPAVPRPRTDARFVVPVVAIGFVLIMVTSGGYRFGIITSLIMSIAAMSLVVLTGLIGQISLAQAGLAGTGGFILSELADGMHIPFPISTILASLAAAGFGIIVGLPALRIRGAQLAVVTLAAALALEQFVFNNPSFGSAAGAVVPDATFLGMNLAVQKGTNTARWQFGILVLIVVVLIALAVGNLIKSDTGKAFLAIRSNERASAAAGIGVTSNKLLAFGLASFLAGLCGAFIGYSRGQISGDSFSSMAGVTLLVFAYLGGITSISGAVIAGTLAPLGIGYVVINRIFPHLGNQYVLISSVGLILTAIFNPEGMSSVFASQIATVKSWVKRPAAAPRLATAAATDAASAVGATDDHVAVSVAALAESLPPDAPTPPIEPGEPALRVQSLSVTYGGIRAVDDITLEVAPGEIVGLIGPNGAGKTSFVDAVTGFTGCRGRVIVAGEDLEGRGPSERARLGLSRTWQSVELFRDLTVRDNIAVSTSRPSFLGTLKDLVQPRSRASAEALWAASLLGVEKHLDMQPGDLSLGQQKLVGVARALAPRPAVVLLDEPAAGLDSSETKELGGQIAAIAGLGTAILLIDHDMDLVLQICHRVYVIDFGRLIATGTPDEIRNDPEVIAAYLGQDADADADAVALAAVAETETETV